MDMMEVFKAVYVKNPEGFNIAANAAKELAIQTNRNPQQEDVDRMMNYLLIGLLVDAHAVQIRVPE